MKKSGLSALMFMLLLISLNCSVLSTSIPPTNTPILSTSTPEPTATATQIPSPTPLPGSVVLPVDTLGKSNPWLPLNKSARPSIYFLYFNFSKPPFNNVLVRQAFAAAIDREALVKIAQKYGATNPKPATSFTPSETLGRDLYNEVGIPFNPTKAKELLAQAGYTDASNFPTPTLLISNAVTNVPGFHVKITEAITDMWQQNLGVKVTFQVLEIGAYFNRIDSDPTELFRLISIAENNDPSDFLETFKTGAEYNYGGFSNSEFDKLINLATESNDPAKRQELYIQAERVLCETEAAIIPIYYSTYNIP